MMGIYWDFDGIVPGYTFSNWQQIVKKLDQEFMRSVFEVSDRVFMTGPVDLEVENCTKSTQISVLVP
jgi:hypothetical protein